MADCIKNSSASLHILKTSWRPVTARAAAAEQTCIRENFFLKGRGISISDEVSTLLSSYLSLQHPPPPVTLLGFEQHGVSSIRKRCFTASARVFIPPRYFPLLSSSRGPRNLFSLFHHRFCTVLPILFTKIRNRFVRLSSRYFQHTFERKLRYLNDDNKFTLFQIPTTSGVFVELQTFFLFYCAFWLEKKSKNMKNYSSLTNITSGNNQTRKNLFPCFKGISVKETSFSL